MADTLTELYEILKPDGEIEDDQRDQVFQLLSDYREMLDVVVSSSSINGYVGAFKDDTEKLDIDKDLLETTNDLESLSKLLTGSHIDNNVRKVVHYCKAINARFTIAAPHQPLAPIYLLEDVFSRIQDKEFSLHEKLVEISVTAVDITHKIVLGFIDKTSYVDIGLINEHIETFQKIITHELSAEAGDDEDHHEFLENYGIKPHFMELLTAVNIHDLRKSIDEGNDVYEIVADLDGDMTVTQAFVGWMQENGQSITSRTVFDGDEKTKFDFLYVSSLSPADAKKQIEDITADKSLLALTSIHDGASEEVVAPVASEKVEESVKTAATEEKEVVAPSVEAKKPAEKAKPSKAKTNTTIRVESETLDRFMNQLGELVLARGMLTHAILGLDIQESFNAVNGFVGELDKNNESANGQSLDVVKKALTVLESQQDLIRQADLQIQTVLERLQEDALSLRVVPISTVFNRLPRVVRDLSVAQGKKVKLEMVGKEVRIDKGMVDMLVDPMIHMVRNSVDHGVELPEDRIKSNKSENAIVTISAKQQGDRVRIDIIDDGAGIDHQRVLDKAVSRGLLSERESQNINAHQALQYIFSPGLSTAEKVTETSGRGVGMDVVKNTIIQLGGEVSVASTVGEGSQMNIVLPLTAAIQTTLMMEINNQRVAIPDRNVEEVFEVAESEIQSVKGRRAILLRNSFLPIVHLSDILGFPRNQEERKNTPIAVIKNEEFRIGVEVDVLLHREELFLKDIHPDLAALPGVGGVSICGDGSVILVLDTDQLFELAAKFHEGDYLKMQKSQQNTDGLVAV
jgi:chemotaxis protein histidine kinase CheA